MFTSLQVEEFIKLYQRYMGKIPSHTINALYTAAKHYEVYYCSPYTLNTTEKFSLWLKTLTTSQFREMYPEVCSYSAVHRF